MVTDGSSVCTGDARGQPSRGRPIWKTSEPQGGARQGKCPIRADGAERGRGGRVADARGRVGQGVHVRRGLNYCTEDGETA